MTRYRITHVTRYAYAEPVAVCQNVARLTPRDTPGQWCERSRLAVSPVPASMGKRADVFGNPTTHFAVQGLHAELVVTADHRVTVRPVPPPAADRTPPWEAVRDRLTRDRSPAWLDAYQFAFASPGVPAGDAFRAFAAESFPPGRPTLAGAADLCRRLHQGFRYDPTATTVATPAADVLAARRGVCQDFAHVMLAGLRAVGLAGRYVSGYLSTVPPPGRPRLVGADATHAWVGVFCGDAGWVDLDPTNDATAGDRHVTLAWGRDFHDVSPVKGVVLGGGRHAVTVRVDVHPEDPADWRI
jgi:transglutaminase-like putative cysteine protease